MLTSFSEIIPALTTIILGPMAFLEICDYLGRKVVVGF
jgi:hypothetical protein